MKIVKMVRERFDNMHPYSKMAIRLGGCLMVMLYIVAAFAYIIAPHMPNYFGAMSIYYGAVEAAPACLASAVCAAILCDLAYHSYKKNDDTKK